MVRRVVSQLRGSGFKSCNLLTFFQEKSVSKICLNKIHSVEEFSKNNAGSKGHEKRSLKKPFLSILSGLKFAL